MRWRMSEPMSRPSSAWPKSNAKSVSDFSKKIVSVSSPIPEAALFQTRGLS